MQSEADRSIEKAPLLCSVNEAASLLGLGRTVTSRLFNTGSLHSVKVGGRRLVPRRSLDRFVDELAERPV